MQKIVVFSWDQNLSTAVLALIGLLYQRVPVLDGFQKFFVDVLSQFNLLGAYQRSGLHQVSLVKTRIISLSFRS